MIDWKQLSDRERELVGKIVDRCLKRMPHGNRIDFIMDIEAAHSKCPLDFEKLLAFDDLNFYHDIIGINTYLNRVTGDLMDCFLPRSAA